MQVRAVRARVDNGFMHIRVRKGVGGAGRAVMGMAMMPVVGVGVRVRHGAVLVGRIRILQRVRR